MLTPSQWRAEHAPAMSKSSASDAVESHPPDDGSRHGPDLLRSIGVLVLRATVGALLAGHGTQKLLGWFGGGGVDKTGTQMESMGLSPGRPWAAFAGVSELAGGLLTALGFLSPVGPLMAAGAMLVAARTVHSGKPIWITKGGAELPVTNLAALGAVMAVGPGSLSLDRLFGIRLPRLLALPGLAAVGVMTWLTLESRSTSPVARAGGKKESRDA